MAAGFSRYDGGPFGTSKLLTVGDNVYNHAHPTAYAVDNQAYYPQYQVRPTLGNHDFLQGSGGNGWLTYLAFYNGWQNLNQFTASIAGGNPTANTSGGRYYTFTDANNAVASSSGPAPLIQFFAISSSDSREMDPPPHSEPHDWKVDTSPQYAWMKYEMQNSDACFRVAYFHHPPRSSSASHAANPQMDWPWKSPDPAQNLGIDIVLNGHSHHYEHIYDGAKKVLYFINGMGGAKLHRFSSNRRDAQSRKRYPPREIDLPDITHNEHIPDTQQVAVFGEYVDDRGAQKLVASVSAAGSAKLSVSFYKIDVTPGLTTPGQFIHAAGISRQCGSTSGSGSGLGPWVDADLNQYEFETAEEVAAFHESE